MSGDLVYLDNNATTRVSPEVVEVMLPFFSEKYGNPSSPYSFARSAALAVDDARKQAAALIGAEPRQITFTSGGTEGNAMTMLGLRPEGPDRREIVMSAVEHAAVWGWRGHLEQLGYTVRIVPVDADGALDLAALEGLLSERTAVVSVMAANNETGVLYPVSEVARLAHRVGALVHSDAVQAAGKIPVNVVESGVDSAVFGSHKHNGTKGIGFLYTRDASIQSALFHGGEQEAGMRPGTESVPLAAGLGKAAEMARVFVESDGPRRLADMRDAFEAWLTDAIPGVLIAGAAQPRLPNTTLALIDGVETEPLLALLDMEGIACSSGSACSSGAHEASHVLKAMGIDRDAGGTPRAVLRVSSGRYTTDKDYARLRDVLPSIVKRLRG